MDSHKHKHYHAHTHTHSARDEHSSLNCCHDKCSVIYWPARQAGLKTDRLEQIYSLSFNFSVRQTSELRTTTATRRAWKIKTWNSNNKSQSLCILTLSVSSQTGTPTHTHTHISIIFSPQSGEERPRGNNNKKTTKQNTKNWNKCQQTHTQKHKIFRIQKQWTM